MRNRHYLIKSFIETTDYLKEMEKNMKRISSLITVIALVFSMSTAVNATESASLSKDAILLLDGVEVTTSFSKNDVKVVYGEDKESYYAEVFNSKTGERLTKYGVEKEVELGTKGNTFRNIYEDVDYGFGMIDGRLYTRLIITGSGSFAQISGISDTWWSETGAGVGELTNKNCDTLSSTGSFPTYKIETDGSATCKVAVDLSTSTTFDGSVTIKMLVDVGFSQSYTASGTVYFIKDGNSNYTYRLY